MHSIPLKHKMFRYHSDMGHCFSKVVVVSKKKKKKKIFLYLGKTDMALGKKIAIFDGNGAEIRPQEMGRKFPV